MRVCGADIYLDDDYRDSYENEGLDPDQVRLKADKVELYDRLIGATFLLDPLRNADKVATQATVKERRKDPFGNPIGKAHANPLLDTREDVVELEDGSKETYFANVIAENLWSQCNEEGREFLIFKEILDHHTNGHALPIADGFTTRNGRQFPKKTTAGWELMVEFADGNAQWLPLKEVKESNPVELAEYVLSNKIQEEPAFKWWVPTVLRKQYWCTTHKFWIKLPKTVEEALRLDAANRNHLWEDAIKKEMSKVCIACIPVEGCTPAQVRANEIDQLRGYQDIQSHIVFDVKIDSSRKACFVAGGHMTDTPNTLTYSSLVSRDSVKIAFLYCGT
jgi:hypothetical protein